MKEQDNKNLEIKTPKRQQMTSGAILEIPINDEYYTYAQIQSFVKVNLSF